MVGLVGRRVVWWGVLVVLRVLWRLMVLVVTWLTTWVLLASQLTSHLVR